MPHSLIVLDYDGVIVDSLDYCLERAIAVCSDFPCKRLPARKDWVELDDVTWEGVGRQIGIPEGQLAAFKKAVYHRLGRDVEHLHMFPKMMEVIKQLSVDYLLAVVTTNAFAVVEAVLSRGKLDSLIQIIAGADFPGAKSDKILRILKDLGAEARRAYLVGDTVSDIREARLSGICSVAATWGWQPRIRLKKASPDFYVTSPSELLSFFAIQACSGRPSENRYEPI